MKVSTKSTIWSLSMAARGPRYGQFCPISTFCSPTPIVPFRAGICAGCSHRERGLFANPNDQ
jgi:hypothetical protein